MAEIYLARPSGRRDLADLVVIKRILPHLAEEKSFVEMFIEEARLAAMVDHPNVVHIHEVGQDEHEYFMVMEYVDGPSAGALARRARERARAMPTSIATSIVMQACDGLHAVHEICADENGDNLGIVHRDVSPHNLMISRAGVVKLVDFGVAKAKDTNIRTNTGGIKGKFPYMSPEQAEGLDLDRRSDIFSLGTVFYELVTGKRLFLRSSELTTLRAICEEPITPPREINNTLDARIEEVIMRALERDRKQRFPTTLAMKEALAALLMDEATATGPDALARYFRGEFGPVLDRRVAALARIARKPTGAIPALVRGFDDNETSAGVRQRRPTSELEAADIAVADLAVAAITGLPAEDTTVDERGRLRRDDPPSPMRRWTPWMALLAVALGIAAGLGYRLNAEHSSPALRLGLTPVQPAPTMRRAMEPLASYLGDAVGRRIELVVTQSYDDLRKRLLAGELDFASLPPLQVVRARNTIPNLRTIAASAFDGAATYQAYLLVRTNSGFERLEQLRNKRICYVDPGSASGYLMPRHFLRSKGLDPDRFFVSHHFSRTQPGVLRDLLAKRCDVAAAYSEYRIARKEGIPTSAVKILAITGDLPNDCICAAPHLSPKLFTQLQQALLRFDPKRDLGEGGVDKAYPMASFVRPNLANFERLAAAERAEREGQ